MSELVKYEIRLDGQEYSTTVEMYLTPDELATLKRLEGLVAKATEMGPDLKIIPIIPKCNHELCNSKRVVAPSPREIALIFECLRQRGILEKVPGTVDEYQLSAKYKEV
jgi:hypothetical protein